MLFKTEAEVNWVIFYIYWFLISFFTLYLGLLAIPRYFDRLYLEDFEYLVVLFLVGMAKLIFTAICVVTITKKIPKIAILLFVLTPLVLLILIGYGLATFRTNDYPKFESIVSWEGRIIELAPPGPGFPVYPIDFPGNSLIPWLGWNGSGLSWDDANETCSALNKDGDKLIYDEREGGDEIAFSQRGLWRLPTFEETKEIIKVNNTWAPKFRFWWTATISSYEKCWVSKNGQCHEIFNLERMNDRIISAYLPMSQAYRCIRDIN